MTRTQSLTCLLLTYILISFVYAKESENPLAVYLWENRVIVVQCYEGDSAGVLRELEASSDSIDERHIVWFVLSDAELRTNALGNLPENFGETVRTRMFGTQSKGLRVALIGKDGGVKSVDDSLDLKAIFGRIDSMPMRQAEMGL